ncbi:zinc finger CCCH domain-containing protein 67 isoform X3 [Lycium barbarum]|uniref:zinc finger CCCH domain-containing protein 67 isoform X3 n=1 Tax=Lycium barbarum TaxID=112863 RepID=UPI00293EE274|nr:zinc finger CCCH domain-containing protein 67 isoform X3 [Lycium barbarum]
MSLNTHTSLCGNNTMGNNVPNRMEEAIEQHQPLGHTERELGLQSQTPKTTSLQSDPNSQNPNENQPKTDDEDEMAMKIICDERQNNLVLSQVLELDHQENGKMKERLESEVENNVEDEMAMQIICDELQNNLVLSQVLELDHQEDGKMKERLESEVKNNVERNDDDGWGYDGDDGWGYDDDENRSESQNNGEKENGFEEGDSSKEVGFNKANRIKRKFNSRLRPDAQGCPYKLKTGTCKFGSNCKFNHHPKRKFQGTKEKGKQREESQERPGQIECKYYLTSGGCKYGKACKFSHSREKGSISPIVEFNFLGLPIRLGERECPYYMRTGSCKYGSNCRFHHPDPTTVAGADPPPGYNNAGAVPIQASSHSAASSWSSPRALNDTAPYVPMMYPPTQGIPSPNTEWNGYQAPVYPTSEKRLPTPPAFAMNNPATKTNFYPRPQQPLLIDEYPERPGQPECSFFIKTGDCKYKSNCKFHHPKSRISKANSSILNDKGLPLRPDQTVCSFYSRYGICKFGPACKFDHPENYVRSAASTESGFDQHQQSQMSPGWQLEGDH